MRGEGGRAADTQAIHRRRDELHARLDRIEALRVAAAGLVIALLRAATS